MEGAQRARGMLEIANTWAVAQSCRMSQPTDTRSRRLRGQGAPEGQAPESLPRHPPWIRMKLPSGQAYFDLRARVHAQGLHTVCESASCPNIGECWSRGSLTLMILGGICTRSCRFCDVPTGRPLPPDPDEPERVAGMLANLGLRHAVITCVDRDDLADGGAAHWAATIRAVKGRCPDLVLETLTGDFAGDPPFSIRVDTHLTDRSQCGSDASGFLLSHQVRLLVPSGPCSGAGRRI